MKRMDNKYLAKVSGILGSAFNAIKGFGNTAVADAPHVGSQLKAVGSAFKAGSGRMNAVDNLVSNKAVQAGAGLVGAGVVGGAMYAHNKQAEENKYLTKIASDKWIGKATKNKGGLHRSLGIPEGEKIPDEKIREAEKKPGKVGKEARLAETLKGMKHGKE